MATWVPCTKAEGPGVRFALWVQGCPLRCPGCCNPEMFSDAPRQMETVASVLEMILDAKREHDIEGVSFLGGEPLSQAAGLAALAEQVQKYDLSVMVFSGYTREEMDSLGSDVSRLLQHTDILVDGRYDATLHTNERRWIGSTNQRVHFLSSRYDPADPAWEQPNSVDIHFDGKELFITGFPQGPWKELLEAWQDWQRKKDRLEKKKK